MPAKSPLPSPGLEARLIQLGERIRKHRKRLGISATAAAESAGMSRVTWHRIERGEPSVTMGAWLGAARALGLELETVDPAQKPVAPQVPESIRLADYPELQRLAWQQPGTETLSAEQALSLYERNWRHLEDIALQPHERALILALVASIGGGRALV
jgi:transcriptional regulator with XRE-family HTH domain